MHRQMRRIKQQLSHEAAVRVMREATSGVLALEGDDGYPYAVPISHVWTDECLGGEDEFIGRIYFHSAREGYKIDSIMDSEKASFAVVVRDEIVPDEYTTYFKSAIATGRVHVLEDDEERLRGLRALAEKYNPGQQESAEKEISGALSHVAVIAFEVEELTGKQARELASREAKASGVE